ncbi:zinc finger and BTB domain-containing protein 25 [Synchiropus splendidus]|uniref:zinc finger and BTB domain-containing protein 25 n=1 Tax=Synchiropus splendidus TaxID=270530 RepID=UPI00237E0ED8|nr:zinc finger and BTB domain-containing protein 25 [Synchiropus splendidus]XP_053737935.1 zinc finger and BTB domain-containing protein 25 [Synchiropus splendidus]
MEVSSHSLFLLQQLNVQREFGFLCDCTVAIGNVYFKAHRAVLAAFSNYFKMIFIHQSSECIKIQPTDIQPDVFSYLLHLMYTGSRPQQPVDQTRLQDGVRFLHAYQLAPKSNDGADEATVETPRMSNLYGIQISSQLATKEASADLKAAAASSMPAEGGRQGRLSFQAALERLPSDHQLPSVCSMASGDTCDTSTHIKQETGADADSEGGTADAAEVGPPAQLIQCPRCGEQCSCPESLRLHLFSHTLEPAHLMGGLSQGLGEGPVGSQEQLEEALRQSQVLASQLAAELKRSRSEGQIASSPAAALNSRKRKIACAVCCLRFSHKGQLQEHMYAHTGKPRLHRHSRPCSQLFPGAEEYCESDHVGEGSRVLLSEEVNRDVQDNGSSSYSLDSEVSQESADGRCNEIM